MLRLSSLSGLKVPMLSRFRRLLTASSVVFVLSAPVLARRDKLRVAFCFAWSVCPR